MSLLLIRKIILKINCYVTEDTVIVQPGVLNHVQIMNLLLGSYNLYKLQEMPEETLKNMIMEIYI